MNSIERAVCSASSSLLEGDSVCQHEPATNKTSEFVYFGPTPSPDWFLPNHNSRDLHDPRGQNPPDIELPTKPESKTTTQLAPVSCKVVSIPVSKSATNLICGKLLSFAFIYSICGNLFILPICFELVILLVTEIANICAKITETVAKSREQKERDESEAEAWVAEHEQLEIELAVLMNRPPDNELNAIRKELKMKYGKTRPSAIGSGPARKSAAFRLHKEILGLEADIKFLSRNLASMCVENVKIANASIREPENETTTAENLQGTFPNGRVEAEKRGTEELRKPETGLSYKELKLRPEGLQPQHIIEPQIATTLGEVTTPLLSNLPHDLQTLDPLSVGFTCIGTTTPGKRCKHTTLPLSDFAARSLSLMRQDSTYGRDLSSLEYLASSMMCTRWHSRDALFPQYEEAAAKWAQELKEADGKIAVEEGSRKSADVRPVTPVQSTITEFPQTPSSHSSSSHSASSSMSSIFSNKSFEMPLSTDTSPGSSPLAAKSRKVEAARCSCMRKSDGTGYGWCPDC